MKENGETRPAPQASRIRLIRKIRGAYLFASIIVYSRFFLKSALMSTRTHNEKKFGQWDELPDGGRRYYLEVAGRHGWIARYVKEVTSDETTRRFWQEIYDDSRQLVEIHEKFPVDRGHQKV